MLSPSYTTTHSNMRLHEMECLHEELFICKPNYVIYLIVKSQAELSESCLMYVHAFQLSENLIELVTLCFIDDFKL
jgi:hypothetical protein